MTDNRQMFLRLRQAFLLHLPRSAGGDIRRLVTLAWAVVGLCLSQKASLSSWGEAVESEAHQAASHTRRFQGRVWITPIFGCKPYMHGWYRPP